MLILQLYLLQLLSPLLHRLLHPHQKVVRQQVRKLRLRGNHWLKRTLHVLLLRLRVVPRLRLFVELVKHVVLARSLTREQAHLLRASDTISPLHLVDLWLEGALFVLFLVIHLLVVLQPLFVLHEPLFVAHTVLISSISALPE